MQTVMVFVMECEYFEDEGEEASTVFGMENEEVFFRILMVLEFGQELDLVVINDEATFTFNYGVYYQTPTYDNVYLNTNRQEDLQSCLKRVWVRLGMLL